MQIVHFTPPQLAPLFGVNVSTIKRWADKGYLPTEKTSGGHRRVSREQLLHFIKTHPKHSKNSYVLRRLLKKDFCLDEKCWKDYYKLLLKNENQSAGQLVERLYLGGTPIIDILRSVITPTMRQIAEEWANNNITVYDEHRMSFNIRTHLQRLDQFIPEKSTKNSPSGILTCAPGEYHELPLQLIALIFKLNSWRTHILGVNIPINQLLKAADNIKPKVLIISKTYTTKESAGYFNTLTNYSNKHNICIALGGATWKRRMAKEPWMKKSCAHYFPALNVFSDFLKNYKRK